MVRLAQLSDECHVEISITYIDLSKWTATRARCHAWYMQQAPARQTILNRRPMATMPDGLHSSGEAA